ncbi:PDGLE domain-containing protein [Cohnella silvisoli]|uniref:PDGLE domain-containing protein n=1 Tax=Cohnella silvisoli TaxID=2873699 RepID=A0ABV1L3Y2_9BACL|nr:PDGLE domain-containing protein [Cohnella silvisoli]MCD9026283.1 PDGLE domain-containing protein [Cohnella silvisoli]
MSKPLTVTGNKRKWIVMAIITLIAAGIISFFASSHPDGLERVAADHGFLDEAKKPSWTAWISGYELPGIAIPILKVGLAGIIGVALLFLVLYGLTSKLTRREEEDHVGENDHHPS